MAYQKKNWYNTGEPEANDNNSIFESINKKIQDSGWINLVLKSGITPHIDTPRYRKIGNVVYLNGRFKGLTELNQVFATLPVGYRPTEMVNFTCTGTVALTWRLYVTTDGSMGIGGNSKGSYNADDWYAMDCSFVVG